MEIAAERLRSFCQRKPWQRGSAACVGAPRAAAGSPPAPPDLPWRRGVAPYSEHPDPEEKAFLPSVTRNVTSVARSHFLEDVCQALSQLPRSLL